MVFPTLAISGRGAVVAVANVAPKLLVKLYRALKRGDVETARQLQMKVSRLKVLVNMYN